MTTHIEDYSDIRHKAWCIHCHKQLAEVASSYDHVPSQCLLSELLPAHLPIIPICAVCNAGFSPSERYVSAVLGTVLAGELYPSEKIEAKARRILKSDAKLRRDIRRRFDSYTSLDGHVRTYIRPKMDRVEPVLIKNARGHAFYELGEPLFDKPVSVRATPLEAFSIIELKDFEAVGSEIWPEVGCRMMFRLVEGHDLEPNGWISVVPGRYRYGLKWDDQVVVRTIIAEYLATEVVFEK